MTHQTLITPKWILTMQDQNPVLQNSSIILENKKIKKIVSNNSITNLNCDEHINLPHHVVMPGLINLHGHSAMFLLRGRADDLKLQDWLNNYIWPLEKKFVSPDFVYDGSLLAMAEMIRGGITTINDMYFFHEYVAKAAFRMGMRIFIGCTVMEYPTSYAQNADEYLTKALKAKNMFLGQNLVSFSLAPHAPYSVSDRTFKKIIQLSNKENMLVHCHIHETIQEIEESIKEYDLRPIDRLEKLGLLNNNLVAAHMVHLNETEIEKCSKYKLSVAHNPSSNMKLASGFAKIQKMLDHNICVGIGTDGAASNNKLDILSEIRLASLIAKGYSKSPTELKALDVLKMATINGAKALHIDDKVGTIEEGKHADLIAINMHNIENQPLYNIISNIVYSSGRENISHVWIDGELLLKDRILKNIEEEEIFERIQKWQNKINLYAS